MGIEHNTDGTYRIAEPVAAEQIDGEECSYGDCDNGADWLVEVQGWVGFMCCQQCSVKNRIYAEENELYKNNVSESARENLVRPKTEAENHD